MTVIFVFNVNIPEQPVHGALLRSGPAAGPFVCPPVPSSPPLRPDPGFPGLALPQPPAPATGDPVTLTAFRLLKGTVHSTRLFTFKRFAKLGSSVRCFFPLIYKLSM